MQEAQIMINQDDLRVGFVGFGEVNSPRDLIERKCLAAQNSLRNAAENAGLHLQLVTTAPVSDDPDGMDVKRARQELAVADFDVLIVCLAGWIPSHAVLDVVSPFAHKPVALWGLAGEYVQGHLVTTADQAGTTALRDVLECLGFRYKYVYDTPDAPYAAAERVLDYCRVAHATARLRTARIGSMGWRDMKLSATLVDQVSLRRVIGVEIETFETLEISQRMLAQDQVEVNRISTELISSWQSDKPLTHPILEPSIRLYLAVMEIVHRRSYQGVTLIDVDGVKKLLGFTPAAALMILSNLGGITTIPENDGLGAVTQLMVRFLTGQPAAYFEFYEFFKDRVLIGVPDYVPSGVVDGPVKVRLTSFGQLSEGVLNVSKVKTGRITLCRLASRGDLYRLHVLMGEAVSPRPWEEAGWTPPAPQLPSLEVILDGGVDDFAQNVCGQHYILAYGDIRAQLADLCNLLGVNII
jgi:L-fucose isomerase-like protein